MNMWQKWITGVALSVFASFGVYLFAQGKSFIWDSNVEADMKEYVLVVCPASPCTISAAGAVQTVVPHVKGQATQSSPVPAGKSGEVVVYARDLSGNLSAPSNEISFDSLAPFGPKNLRVG